VDKPNDGPRVGLIATFTDLHFPFIQKTFDDEEKLLDPAPRAKSQGLSG